MGSFGHYEQNYSHVLADHKCGGWMNEPRELLTLLESLLNANLVRTASLLYIVKIITLVGASFICNCNPNWDHCITNDFAAKQLQFKICIQCTCVKQIIYYSITQIRNKDLLKKNY